MFMCTNMCNSDANQPEITVNPMNLHSKITTSIQTELGKAIKQSSITFLKSKYKDYRQECQIKKIRFVDKQFPPNETNLHFNVTGRSITWKRISQIIKDGVMYEPEFKLEDICQGNLNDCYFFSSIAALAQIQERISNIFYENFEACQQGIYKLIIIKQGTPTEMIIDDYVPVFAETNRPVFCKPIGQEIWLMLIQKVWAKIKGSYGAISSGCPHEVLSTFSVAPCYFHQIYEGQDQQQKDFIWQQLISAADHYMPIVAGTTNSVKIQGLLPFHAYTVLDCKNVVTYGKEFRLVKLRNHWSKTEYTGYGGNTDKTFWDGVAVDLRDRFMPEIGGNSKDFILPFDEFLNNFDSFDISKYRFGFSYEFEQLKMPKGRPLFVRLNVKEQHQGYITIKRKFSEGSNQGQGDISYGYARVIVALQRDFQTFEYYGSQLQNALPDLNFQLDFKLGNYVIMIQTQDPRPLNQSQSILGYYFDTLQLPNSKEIIVQYSKIYPKFLEQVWINHAIRMNTEKSKIGPKSDDWIKTAFLYNGGGYGYVMCNLQHDTSIKMAVTISNDEINENGFYLLGQHPQQHTLTAGASKIYIFSCNFKAQTINNITFPPPGFKLLRIA